MDKTRALGQENKAKLMTMKAFAYIFLIFVAILSLFSFYLLIINATRSHAELQAGFTMIPSTHFVDNFDAALFGYDPSSINVPVGMFNSLVIAISSSVLSVYFSAMTAYAVHVYDFRLKKFTFNFIMLVMMIPTQVSIVGFVQLVNTLKLTQTFWPLIIPAIASPATFFYMRQYMQSALPLEIVEAARVDGSNEFRTFNMISLPMMRPAMAVQLIFAFVASWNNYFTPALILGYSTSKGDTRTLPIMIATLKSIQKSQDANLGAVYMVIFLSILPVVLVYLLVSKNIVGGVALGAVKG